MSLTDLILNKDSKGLRHQFKTVFPRPKIKLTGDILAPPLTKNYSTVGGAFDYLLRFTLEHRYKSKVVSNVSWVADEAYRRILEKIESVTSETIRIGYHSTTVQNREEFISILKSEYAMAKQNYVKYLSDGIITDFLITSVLFLARLDVYVRVRIIDDRLGHETELDIKDVRQLMSLVNNECFVVSNVCWLNPTFGEGSKLVGGADADLIIDDTLIDIKATTNLLLDRNHLNQLIGYYVLSLIGGVHKAPDCRPIKNIGIYFARHGVLTKIPISDLANEEKVLKFKNWFIKYVKRSYH